MPTISYEHLMDMSNWTVNDEGVEFLYWEYGDAPEGGSYPAGFEGVVILTGVVDDVPLEIKADIEHAIGQSSFHAKLISATPDVDVSIDGELVPFSEVAVEVVNEKEASDELYSPEALEELEKEIAWHHNFQYKPKYNQQDPDYYPGKDD